MNTTNTPEETIRSIRTLKDEATRVHLKLEEVILPVEEFRALKEHLDKQITFTFNPDDFDRTELEFEGVKVYGNGDWKMSAILTPALAPKLVTDDSWRRNAETLAGINQTLVDAGVRKDNAIRGLSADVERLTGEKDNWVETAEQHLRNEFYYCGLLDQLAVMLGFECLIADDGSLSDSPLRAKLPGVLSKKLLRLWELEAWQEWSMKVSEPETDGCSNKAAQLRGLLDTQSQNGNWNYDPYMHGMHTGMELSLAILEDREPEYKTAPEQWLSARSAASVTSKLIPGGHVENAEEGLRPTVGSVWSFEDEYFTVSSVGDSRISFGSHGWTPLQCFFEIYTPVTNG